MDTAFVEHWQHERCGGAAAMTRLQVAAVRAVFCRYEPTPDDPEGSSHGPVAGSWTSRRLDAVAGRSERLPGLERVGYLVEVHDARPVTG